MSKEHDDLTVAVEQLSVVRERMDVAHSDPAQPGGDAPPPDGDGLNIPESS